jgi:hypothetical protein
LLHGVKFGTGSTVPQKMNYNTYWRQILKSIISTHVEVLEEISCVEFSHLYALDTMLLHHTPLEKKSWTPIHELLY